MRLVFFTGAGMSRESGLPTFRGEGGIWDEIDYEQVATRRAWNGRGRGDMKERRQKMLDFFNPLRRMILSYNPNEGHHLIASLEKEHDVTIITQNGDDYHTRAGSTDVIYLHGEALKNASSANPYLAFPIDRENPDIRLGDKAPDGSQLRPFVIYFDEDIDRRLWQKAVVATREADCFVVVGSSMLVYPAAELLSLIRSDCRLIIIDPGEVKLPDECHHPFTHIRATATEGLRKLYNLISSSSIEREP